MEVTEKIKHIESIRDKFTRKLMDGNFLVIDKLDRDGPVVLGSRFFDNAIDYVTGDDNYPKYQETRLKLASLDEKEFFDYIKPIKFAIDEHSNFGSISRDLEYVKFEGVNFLMARFNPKDKYLTFCGASDLVLYPDNFYKYTGALNPYEIMDFYKTKIWELIKNGKENLQST